MPEPVAILEIRMWYENPDTGLLEEFACPVNGTVLAKLPLSQAHAVQDRLSAEIIAHPPTNE